jgi:hypothetical protein
VKELADFTFHTIRENPIVVPVPAFLAKAIAMPRDLLLKRIPPLLFNHMASGDFAQVASLVLS